MRVRPRSCSPTSTTERVQSQAWLKPHFATADGRLIASIHALRGRVARARRSSSTPASATTRRARCACGTSCTGLSSPTSPPPASRRNASTRVLCTHLHVDHVGWNTRLVDGRWVPTFPQRPLPVRPLEYDALAVGRRRGDERQVLADSVQPVIDAGLVDLGRERPRRSPPRSGSSRRRATRRATSACASAPRGEEAVITGDLMHHPIQCCEPDRRLALRRRSGAGLRDAPALPARAGRRAVLVLGTHFAPPTAGWCVPAGRGLAARAQSAGIGRGRPWRSIAT